MNRVMKSRFAGLGVVALAAASGAANAEVSSTITIASDYDFRGITQTALDPALQASLDWSHENGLYAGLWGSNVDFGDSTSDGGEGGPTITQSGPSVEVDLLVGYGGSITESIGYDIGATYYTYYGESSGLSSVDYGEFHAGLSFGEHASSTVWYSPDYGNSGDSAWYLEGNGDIPLPWELAVTLHAGYSTGDYWESSDDEYFDFAIGLTRTFGHFDCAVKYVDGSDISSLDGTPDDVFSSESKVVFSVATTFPWAKAE
jgi:uncharacterized protein (TIGR02001 family)